MSLFSFVYFHHLETESRSNLETRELQSDSVLLQQEIEGTQVKQDTDTKGGPFDLLDMVSEIQSAHEEQIAHYFELIAEDPDNIENYIVLKDLFLDIENIESAIEILEVLISFEGYDTQYFEELASLYEYLDRPDDAIRVYEQLLGVVDPTNLEAMSTLGSLHYINEEFTIAREYYLRAIEISPDDYSNYKAIADSYFDEENYNTAVEWYRDALNRAEESSKTRIRHSIISCYTELNDWNMVMTSAEEAINEGDNSAYWNMYLAATELERWGDALHAFDSSFSGEPLGLVDIDIWGELLLHVIENVSTNQEKLDAYKYLMSNYEQFNQYLQRNIAIIELRMGHFQNIDQLAYQLRSSVTPNTPNLLESIVSNDVSPELLIQLAESTTNIQIAEALIESNVLENTYKITLFERLILPIVNNHPEIILASTQNEVLKHFIVNNYGDLATIAMFDLLIDENHNEFEQEQLIMNMLTDPALVYLNRIPDVLFNDVSSNPRTILNYKIYISRFLVLNNIPYSLENAQAALIQIQEAKQSMENIPIFNGRTVLFLANNEVWADSNNEIRFGTDSTVNSINDQNPDRFTLMRYNENEGSSTFSEQVLTGIIESPPNLTFIFHGHGGTNSLAFSGSVDPKDPISNQIFIQDFTDALIARHNRIGDNLQNDIYILDGCFQSTFIRNVIEILHEEGLPVPVLISNGEYNNSTSTDDSYYGTSFLADSIGLGNPQPVYRHRSARTLTLGDFINADAQSIWNNPTMYIQNNTGETIQVVENNNQSPAESIEHQERAA